VSPLCTPPCHCRGGQKHHLNSHSIHYPSQSPKVPLDSLQASIFSIITAGLDYQKTIVIRGENQVGKLSGNVHDPSPREAADFPTGRVRLTNRALCSPHKEVAFSGEQRELLRVLGGLQVSSASWHRVTVKELLE